MTVPQAVVKIVRNGGTRTPGQIKNQWKYISKDNTVELLLPESAQNLAMPMEDWDDSAMNWALNTGNYAPGQTAPNDMTTHIVVSFPPGTNEENAKLAARAWAEKMFQPGNAPDGGLGYGEIIDDHSEGFDAGVNMADIHGQEKLLSQNYDYISAFHTDQRHPHTHIVVNRRGDHGGWLKISRRHPVMNYDNMRKVLVEAAGENGIEMIATTRSERGLAGRGMTDAQYRRLQREQAIEIWPLDETDRSIDSHSEPSIDLSQDSRAVYLEAAQVAAVPPREINVQASAVLNNEELSMGSEFVGLENRSLARNDIVWNNNERGMRPNPDDVIGMEISFVMENRDQVGGDPNNDNGLANQPAEFGLIALQPEQIHNGAANEGLNDAGDRSTQGDNRSSTSSSSSSSSSDSSSASEPENDEDLSISRRSDRSIQESNRSNASDSVGGQPMRLSDQEDEEMDEGLAGAPEVPAVPAGPRRSQRLIDREAQRAQQEADAALELAAEAARTERLAQARAAREAERDQLRQNPRRSARLAGEAGPEFPDAGLPVPAGELDSDQPRRSKRIAEKRQREEAPNTEPNPRARKAARENR